MKCGVSFHRRLFSHTQKSANKDKGLLWMKKGLIMLFAFQSPITETNRRIDMNVWLCVCGYRQNRCNNRWGLARAGAALSGQFHKIYSGAPTGERQGSCRASCCLALAQRCAALASFIVAPWSRCDRGGPNWYVMSREQEGWWMNRI